MCPCWMNSDPAFRFRHRPSSSPNIHTTLSITDGGNHGRTYCLTGMHCLDMVHLVATDQSCSLAVYSTCRQKYGRTSVDSQLMKLRLSAHGFCETYKTVAPYERGVQ